MADDAAFALSQAVAEAAAVREAEFKALRRLKRLTDSDDDRVAVRAAEVLVRYAREQRRDARAVDPTRAPAKEAVKSEGPARRETAEKRAIPKGLMNPPRAVPAFRAVPESAAHFFEPPRVPPVLSNT